MHSCVCIRVSMCLYRNVREHHWDKRNGRVTQNPGTKTRKFNTWDRLWAGGGARKRRKKKKKQQGQEHREGRQQHTHLEMIVEGERASGMQFWWQKGTNSRGKASIREITFNQSKVQNRRRGQTNWGKRGDTPVKNARGREEKGKVGSGWFNSRGKGDLKRKTERSYWEKRDKDKIWKNWNSPSGKVYLNYCCKMHG